MLYQFLVSIVQRRAGFIQKHHFRLQQHRTDQGNTLLLAGGQSGCIMTEGNMQLEIFQPFFGFGRVETFVFMRIERERERQIELDSAADYKG